MYAFFFCIRLKLSVVFELFIVELVVSSIFDEKVGVVVVVVDSILFVITLGLLSQFWLKKESSLHGKIVV